MKVAPAFGVAELAPAFSREAATRALRKRRQAGRISKRFARFSSVVNDVVHWKFYPILPRGFPGPLRHCKSNRSM